MWGGWIASGDVTDERTTGLALLPLSGRLAWWGTSWLRGAVGLALALAVPESVPERGQIIVLAFGVVAFSIFLQGLTMPPLLRRWKLTGQDDPDDAPSA